MRKFLCIILTLMIICNYYVICFAEENKTNEEVTELSPEKNENEEQSADEMSGLQQQQQELKEQIEGATENLDNVQSDLSENLQQIQKLDERIESSEKEIKELNEKIDDLKETIARVKEELKKAESNYEKQKETLQNRLIAMYEAGETQYLDVLLKSSDMSDFLSNYFLISEITSYDEELFNYMENKKDVIDLAKKKLDKTNEELEQNLKTETRTSKVLQNTKIMRESFIARLSDEEKALQAKIEEMKVEYANVNSEILQLALQGQDTSYIGGALAWPVPGYTRISSKYGMRVHPITKVYKLHTGVDIAAPYGANFIAANDGIVTKAGYNTAYGNMVIIDHGGGISTLYAHGSEILVQAGQTVTRGETVLKVGSTGYSTGAHAHFEVRINGEVTSPMEYITNGVIPTTSNAETNKNEINQNQTNQNTAN